MYICIVAMYVHTMSHDILRDMFVLTSFIGQLHCHEILQLLSSDIMRECKSHVSHCNAEISRHGPRGFINLN